MNRAHPEDDGIVDEVINDFLATGSGDGVPSTSHDQPGADSTTTVPQEPSVHDTHISGEANDAPDTSVRRSLRQRTQPSYQEPSGGGEASKSKQARAGSVIVPKIPPRCCLRHYLGKMNPL